MKYAFIRDELVGRCTTRMACRLLEVSSNYCRGSQRYDLTPDYAIPNVGFRAVRNP